MRKPAKSSGASILEVVISLLIMTIGLLGLAGLQTRALKDIQTSAQHAQAEWMAHELVERIRANPLGTSNYQTELKWENCTQPKPCNTSSCSPAETAAYDIYQVFCGKTQGNTVSGPVSHLNLSTLKIACEQGCSKPENPLSVSLSWFVSTSDYAIENTNDGVPPTEHIQIRVIP